MLFQQPFVFSNPIRFDHLTRVMEIPTCIAVAQQQLIDGHNYYCGAIAEGQEYLELR